MAREVCRLLHGGDAEAAAAAGAGSTGVLSVTEADVRRAVAMVLDAVVLAAADEQRLQETFGRRPLTTEDGAASHAVDEAELLLHLQLYVERLEKIDAARRSAP